MANRLITNIRQLVNVRAKSAILRGSELAELPSIQNAYLVVENDTIAAYGKMEDLTPAQKSISESIDANGGYVLPCWCDSHTHLVFASSREDEFVDKIRGLTYAEIAAKGGGILNSAKKIAETSEDQLFQLAWDRLQQVAKMGTGAIEIKSGYGLNVESELKMLRVIKKLKEKSSLIIKSTFLGAHAYPSHYRENHEAYLREITDQMLPAIASENLADFVDVFCESGFFSPEEMERVCKAAAVYGLLPKLHINQLNSIGGLQKALQLNALSVDHLETMTHQDVKDLSASNTIGTLLPTAAYFLRMPFQPARELINEGCAIALASDYNPGSSPSGNMNMVVSMSCIQMKMIPEEAINAATTNGAHAMGIGQEAGDICIGKTANLIITQPIPSLAYLPYSFGSDLIDRVIIRGNLI